MGRGTGVFRVSARAAVPVARRAASAPGRIRETVVNEFKGDLDSRVTAIFQDEAPKGQTGELAASVEGTVGFRGSGGVTLTIKADPVSESGFHYLDVTRRGRGPAVAKRGRAVFWESADHPVRSVGPWTPAGDWVDGAVRSAGPVVSEAADKIGRQLRTRIL